jgi:hypothetical protein
VEFLPALKQKSFSAEELHQRKYLRRDEFSFLTGISQRTLSDYQGTVFPYIKLGRCVLIDRKKAFAALEQLERGPGI